MRAVWLVALCALVAVATAGCTPSNDCGLADDFDCDGTPDRFDCAPADPAVHERDVDGDLQTPCGGDCDDADPDRHTLDLDGDGISTCDEPGDCDDTAPACAADCEDADGDGSAVCAGDCDDADPNRFLGAEEACDGLDTDCNGVIPSDETTDADGDGYALCADCNDTNVLVHPEADEVCNAIDDDCDGDVDEGTGAADVDGDGAPSCFDCDDLDPNRYPNAFWTEVDGDGLDANCDGDDAILLSEGWASLGWDSNIRFGSDIERIGDLDGDGRDDLIVTAQDYGSDDGAAIVVSTSVFLASGVYGPDDAGRILRGSAGEGCQTARSLGDLDGDGLDELAVGCRKADIEGDSTAEGRFYLVNGTELQGTGVTDLFFSHYGTIAGTDGARIGEGVVALPDLDNDGRAELAFWSPNGGGARLFASWQLENGGPLSESEAATVLANSGAVDAADDLLGWPEPDLFYAGDDEWGVLDGGQALVQGNTTPGLFTGDVDTAFGTNCDTPIAVGDVDGQGVADVIVRCRGLNGGGSSGMLLFGEDLANASSPIPFDGVELQGIPFVLGGAGDLDGDGLGEVLFGSQSARDERGAIYVLPGSAVVASTVVNVPEVAPALIGENANDRVGAHAVIGPDVSGDGVPDLFVVAQQWPAGGVGRGILWVQEGRW